MHPPRDFREVVLADLLRAQRLKIRIEDEIDPQFRIASPDGDWWIALTLDSDLTQRKRQMALISKFMASKLSPAFTMACELAEPDALCCVGVSHRECHGVMSHTRRDPLIFLPEHWLTPEQIDPDLLALLPRRETALDARTLMELKDWFGPRGRFLALQIAEWNIGRDC